MRKSLDPVARYLDDARALARTEKLPEDVLRVIVPTYCRGAIEAACQEVTRRRRLGAGARHADVGDTLAAARTTNDQAALALFDDAQRGGDVLSRLNQYGPWAADAFKAARTGSHTAYTGDLSALVADTTRLTDRLRK